MQKIHLVLCGERGAGKSTLIQRLLEETGLRAGGFYTKSASSDEEGFHDIFIHPAKKLDNNKTWDGSLSCLSCSDENKVGSCNRVIHRMYPEVFDTKGVEALSDIEDCDIIVMDELGFMEKDAMKFRAKVIELLSGEKPVIAVIKNRVDLPFLNQIRQLDRVEVIPVYEREREAVYSYLLKRIRAVQSKSSKR